jgi:hypothetical protein
MTSTSNKRKLFSDLNESDIPFDGSSRGDITFVFGSEAKKIKTFKQNLINISPVFEKMFTNGMQETSINSIALPEDDPEAMRTLVLLSLPGTEAIFTLDKVRTLLPLLDKYEVDPFIKEKCDKYLSTLNSTWEITRLAEEFDLENTFKKSLLWLGENALKIEKDPNYLQGIKTFPFSEWKNDNLVSLTSHLSSKKHITDNIVDIDKLRMVPSKFYEVREKNTTLVSGYALDQKLMLDLIADACPTLKGALEAERKRLAKWEAEQKRRKTIQATHSDDEDEDEDEDE